MFVLYYVNVDKNPNVNITYTLNDKAWCNKLQSCFLKPA